MKYSRIGKISHARQTTGEKASTILGHLSSSLSLLFCFSFSSAALLWMTQKPSAKAAEGTLPPHIPMGNTSINNNNNKKTHPAFSVVRIPRSSTREVLWVCRKTESLWFYFILLRVWGSVTLQEAFSTPPDNNFQKLTRES